MGTLTSAKVNVPVDCSNIGIDVGRDRAKDVDRNLRTSPKERHCNKGHHAFEGHLEPFNKIYAT